MINLLLVEDNPGDARIIKELLLESSIDRVELTNAECLDDAIERIGEKDFDIVISDLSLPDAQGIDTLKSIISAVPEIPVVVLTGNNDDTLGLKLIQQGAQDFLVKGQIDSNLLIRSINYAIERKLAETELQRKKTEIEEAHDKLRTTSQMLIQAEKMSAVGTLVAGVAHELNNPLMGIINAIEMGLRKTDQDDRRYDYLSIAKEATERCIEIVEVLLTFSHSDGESFQRESCLKVLDRVLKLAHYRITKSGIRITQRTNGGDLEVWMRPNNMQQVFFNLISNAIDALEKGERKEIIIDMNRNGSHVEIVIEDTADGIATEHLQRIFDPFFTTKTVGKGTGLGLSICKNIINAHDGDITCRSEVGVGTKFTILLPVERRTKQ
ncbi:MAG: ATP-binding protein [Deltaproteobacteria bacterium]